MVPGGFPGSFGTMEKSSREVPGLFRTTFSDFFGSCSGRSPGNFPGLLEGFGGLLGKIVWGGGWGSVVPMVPYGSPMGPVGALWGPAVGVGGMGAAAKFKLR